jgi:hypothetical protein
MERLEVVRLKHKRLPMDKNPQRRVSSPPNIGECFLQRIYPQDLHLQLHMDGIIASSREDFGQPDFSFIRA